MSNYKSLQNPATFLSPAKSRELLSKDVAILRQELDYEPATGYFTWLREQAYKYKAGDKAGCLNGASGYLQISIRGVLIRAHRLAWLISYGKWAEQTIDHINGDRLDNRLTNLRSVSAQINTQNQRIAHADSLTGFLGVMVAPRANGIARYVARICVGRRHVRLGTFATPAEAHAVYLRAKRRLHDGCTM